MNQQDRNDYYVGRAAISRNLAERARNPAVAAIHLELADRYEVLAAQPHQDGDGQSAAVQAR